VVRRGWWRDSTKEGRDRGETQLGRAVTGEGCDWGGT